MGIGDWGPNPHFNFQIFINFITIKLKYNYKLVNKKIKHER